MTEHFYLRLSRRLDAAFLLAVGSFLLTVELFLLTVDNFSFLAYSWSSFAYSFSFSAYGWSFFAYSGKVRLIRALRDCKQRSLTVSKKAPTVSTKTSPSSPPTLSFLMARMCLYHCAAHLHGFKRFSTAEAPLMIKQRHKIFGMQGIHTSTMIILNKPKREGKRAINLSNLGNFCQIWPRAIYLC